MKLKFKPLVGERREYRAASYALCSAVVGVILMRLISYFAAVPDDTYGMSLAGDALFVLPVQLVFLGVVPFLIFKFYGKRTVVETFEYSSCGAFKPYYLLALPIGFCVWVLTLGISSSWMGLLRAMGYNMPSYTPDMPQNFVFGFFAAEVVMTALLPAVCEEFAMRGGVLTTARKSLGTVGCVVFCAIAFGLFHQNIKQLFYTALFGALAAYLVISMKSLYPAMLMHFANNFCSVYFDYADNYDWAVGGGFFDAINSFAEERVWALVLIYISMAAIAGGLIYLMFYLRERKVVEKKIDVIKDSGFDNTNKRVVLMGEFSDERVQDLEMEKEVYGADYKPDKFKPSARDIMIVVALGVTALLTTVFTFVWGFFY